MDATLDIVDFVLWFLALLSVVIWTIAIAKFVLFMRASSHNRAFLEVFDRSGTIGHLAEPVRQFQGALARICKEGLDEIASWDGKQSELGYEEKKEMLQHALRRRASQERTLMENGMAVLASVGSTAPFVGLFGTVWGIMHALKGISVTGSAGLDVVAGPIGEALIATAIGIATAVPAVLAYNYFLRKVRLAVSEMDHFSSVFLYLAVKSGVTRG